MRHKNKADFIRDKLAQEIQRDTAARDEVQKDLRDAQKAYDEVRADIGQAAADRRAIRRDIDNEQSRLDALKTSVSLLSAAEVAQIPEGVKTPLWGLLGRDNVLIPRETLDKLIKTAGLAEKASREVVQLSAGRREIERRAKADAERLLKQELARACSSRNWQGVSVRLVRLSIGPRWRQVITSSCAGNWTTTTTSKTATRNTSRPWNRPTVNGPKRNVNTTSGGMKNRNGETYDQRF